jgi:putative methyltransferase (TIGR04325 family)
MLSGLIDRLAEEAARIPLLRPILSYGYRYKFNTASGPVRLFNGIYPDFPSALRDIPANRLQGFDNRASALLLAHERFRICPFDYPIMFWLQKLLPECKLLFDLGGNVGTSYFGYRKYMQYPSTLTWLISEVPAVAALGVQIAREESATNLCFTTSLDELPRADILLAAGSLHFIEKPFELLRSAAALPPHVLLNKVPLRDLPAAVTLHNMGSAMCPYHLFNRTQFLTNFQALGYELVAEWETPDLSARIPLFREHSIRAYTGFYFRKPL